MRDRPLHETFITDVLHVTGVTVMLFAPQKLNCPDSQYVRADHLVKVVMLLRFIARI